MDDDLTAKVLDELVEIADQSLKAPVLYRTARRIVDLFADRAASPLPGIVLPPAFRADEEVLTQGGLSFPGLVTSAKIGEAQNNGAVQFYTRADLAEASRLTDEMMASPVEWAEEPIHEVASDKRVSELDDVLGRLSEVGAAPRSLEMRPSGTRGRGAPSSSDLELAETLRRHPGVWIEIEVDESTGARRGWVINKIVRAGAAFRPHGSFQAMEIGERVVARFAGEPRRRDEGLRPEYVTGIEFDLSELEGRNERLLAFLRENRGVWVELVGGAPSARFNVNQEVRAGYNKLFRPRVFFDGALRSGRSFVRYVGPDGGVS